MKKVIKYVQASSYRTKTLKSIAKSPNIPSKIAKDCDIKLNHISNVLNALKKQNLIYYINPEVSKGRVYKITDLGKEVVKEIKD